MRIRKAGLHLASLSERLGPKWKVKRDAVFAQLKASFERKFAEPNGASE